MAGFPCFLEFRFQDPQEAREICVCCLQELIQYKDQGLSRPGDEKECRRACRKLLHPEKETMWERENLAIAKSLWLKKMLQGLRKTPSHRHRRAVWLCRERFGFAGGEHVCIIYR